ncbi:MAG: hypothetical protein WKG07_29755 [Hymenobacter sp.]
MDAMPVGRLLPSPVLHGRGARRASLPAAAAIAVANESNIAGHPELAMRKAGAHNGNYVLRGGPLRPRLPAPAAAPVATAPIHSATVAVAPKAVCF